MSRSCPKCPSDASWCDACRRYHAGIAEGRAVEREDFAKMLDQEAERAYAAKDAAVDEEDFMSAIEQDVLIRFCEGLASAIRAGHATPSKKDTDD